MKTLRACCDCTNWRVFMISDTTDDTAEAIRGHIKFCEDMIILEKELKMLPLRGHDNTGERTQIGP